MNSKKIKSIIENAGGEFIGIKAISKDRPLLVWFHDLKTNSTLTVRLNSLTEMAVKAKLKK
ncbi:MAG: hypothetical protein KKD35_05100 [Elusimicrobia bacterium]|nr:hypothetical protein [Elusimicrobiota bacterium]